MSVKLKMKPARLQHPQDSLWSQKVWWWVTLWYHHQLTSHISEFHILLSANLILTPTSYELEVVFMNWMHTKSSQSFFECFPSKTKFGGLRFSPDSSNILTFPHSSSIPPQTYYPHIHSCFPPRNHLWHHFFKHPSFLIPEPFLFACFLSISYHRIPVHHVFNLNLIPFPPPQSQQDNFVCVTLHPRFTTLPPPVETFLFASISTSSVFLIWLFIFLSLHKPTVKPVFRQRIVPVEINIGNTAKFECETEDAPNVSFKWFKDGHHIKEDDKHRIISRFSTSSLELLTPTVEDSGEYTCKASNQHGSDECSASLSVTGKSDARFLLLCCWRLELLLVLYETWI